MMGKRLQHSFLAAVFGSGAAMGSTSVLDSFVHGSLIRLVLALLIFVITTPFVYWLIRRDEWRLLRAGRLSRGECWWCGYNLTGNTSGICPECGTTVPATTKPD